jgi:hypothetical protein
MFSDLLVDIVMDFENSWLFKFLYIDCSEFIKLLIYLSIYIYLSDWKCRTFLLHLLNLCFFYVFHNNKYDFAVAKVVLLMIFQCSQYAYAFTSGTHIQDLNLIPNFSFSFDKLKISAQVKNNL